MKEIKHHFAVACILIAFLVFASCRSAVPQATSANQTDSISFLVVGDWGKKGKGAQSSVAKTMAAFTAKHPVQFIISTGDNFYYKGVRSTTDLHWKQSFEDIYTAPGLHVPWYPVLGNHDYMQNPQAQIEYTAINNRWTMPGRYYALKKEVNKTTTTLLLFTDTSPLSAQYYPSSLPLLKEQDTAAQIAWIKKELSQSKAQWKIVVGHHPVFSAGKHGNTPDLVRLFQPLFVRQKVDFYIAGHDHSLQYLSVGGEGVNYLISGSGSERTAVSAHMYQHFARSVPGFLVITLYEQKARFYFYNASGKMIYSSEIKKG